MFKESIEEDSQNGKVYFKVSVAQEFETFELLLTQVQYKEPLESTYVLLISDDTMVKPYYLSHGNMDSLKPFILFGLMVSELQRKEKWINKWTTQERQSIYSGIYLSCNQFLENKR